MSCKYQLQQTERFPFLISMSMDYAVLAFHYKYIPGSAQTFYFIKKQPFIDRKSYKGLAQTEAILYAFTPILSSQILS